jgi:hypothetical protein
LDFSWLRRRPRDAGSGGFLESVNAARMSVYIAFRTRIVMKMCVGRWWQSRLSHALDMAKPYECLIWDRGPKG